MGFSPEGVGKMLPLFIRREGGMEAQQLTSFDAIISAWSSYENNRCTG